MVSLNTIRKNSQKVLGLNARYLDYIRPENLKNAIKVADDKVLTKQILSKNGIPVPPQIAVIRNFKQLDSFDFNTLPHSFVAKPVHGLMGGGVEIFYNRDKFGNWIRADRSKVSEKELRAYMKDLLDGKYSLFNEPDQILIEERVKLYKGFKYYAFRGAPDVRIIVYNNIPIMSYVRFPTEISEGKANLDKGAVGAGIDLAVGKTTSAIYGKAEKVEYIPGTTLPVSGIKIPYWNKILGYAIQASKASGLGFAAIDFLIDRDSGPVIVELNARPGLSIQLANEEGLRKRLIKAGGIKVKTVEKGIRLAKDLFGGEIEEEIETISGKTVIGIYEKIKIIGINNKTVEINAKIDTGADSTSIDKQLAHELGYDEIVDVFDTINTNEIISREQGIELMERYREELLPKFEHLADINLIHSSHGSSLRPYVFINMKLDETEFETKATIFDRSHLTYPAIIGRKSLTKFLVDPSKSK